MLASFWPSAPLSFAPQPNVTHAVAKSALRATTDTILRDEAKRKRTCMR
jgi:hypothetical protein